MSSWKVYEGEMTPEYIPSVSDFVKLCDCENFLTKSSTHERFASGDRNLPFEYNVIRIRFLVV